MSGCRKFIMGSLLFLGLILISDILCVQYTAIQALEKGLAYCLANKYDEAIIEFDWTINLNPYLVHAYNGRGMAYSFKRNFDQAIADYSKGIELNPRDTPTIVNRAVAYYFKHEYDRAWQDVYWAQELGTKADPRFLEVLKDASRSRK